MRLRIAKNKEKTTGAMCIIWMVIFYNLFALNRIKYFGGGSIDGNGLLNAIWLFPLLIILKVVLNSKQKSKIEVRFYEDFKLKILVLLLFIVALFGGFKTQNYEQYFYSLLLFFVPMLFIFSIRVEDIYNIDRIIKILVILGCIYSIMALFASMNYSTLMNILGNESIKVQNDQYRASLMMGSSITVSYYLNITLPLSFYTLYRNYSTYWNKFSYICILLNILATTILLSRLSFMISIFITIYYLFFIKSERNSIIKKTIFIILIIILFSFATSSFEIDRLFEGFKDTSTMQRFKAANLGIYIFKNNVFIGSGLGKYFLRAYSTREISVDGILGLVDPHSTYIMGLSELGIIGSAIIIAIFINIFSSFKHIKDVNLRKTAYITLFAYLLGAVGGSHLFNEIIFSSTVYIYIAIFMAIGKRDLKLSRHKKYI